jgi:hypothetical protein
MQLSRNADLPAAVSGGLNPVRPSASPRLLRQDWFAKTGSPSLIPQVWRNLLAAPSIRRSRRNQPMALVTILPFFFRSI